MVETPVDMRRLDVDEGARVDRLRQAYKEKRGEGRARAVHAAPELVVERGEAQSSWRARYRLSLGRSMRADGRPVLGSNSGD
jgi:hypothetical protein